MFLTFFVRFDHDKRLALPLPTSRQRADASTTDVISGGSLHPSSQSNYEQQQCQSPLAMDSFSLHRMTIVQDESPHSLHFMYLDNLHLEIYLWLDVCAALCHGLKRACEAVGLISLFQSASVRLNSTGEPNSGRLQCTTLRSKTDRIRQVSAREQVFWRRGRKNNSIASSLW